MEYAVVSSDWIPDFTEKINALLSQGWELYGSPFTRTSMRRGENTNHAVFTCQAMVRQTDPPKSIVTVFIENGIGEFRVTGNAEVHIVADVEEREDCPLCWQKYTEEAICPDHGDLSSWDWEDLHEFYVGLAGR